MRARTLLALSLTIALGGCDGGGNSAALPVPAQAAAGSRAAVLPQASVGGRAIGAGEGALAFLLADDSHARDLDTLAGAVVDLVEVSQDGVFAFAPGARGAWVVVSAPGKALARESATSDLEVDLRPEARITVEVGEPYACCLVLDARGAPLPLPAEKLVSTADGVLTATRLPTGRYTLLVQSADGTRYATREVTVAEGESRSLRLDLAVDSEGARRFLGAVGGSAALHPLHPEESR